MDRRGYLRATGLAGLSVPTAPRQAGAGREGYDTIRVPVDRPTLQDGVDAATGCDPVLVSEGTYAESVDVTTPGVTVRGRDRNGVVLDGEFEGTDGVTVDGVAVENLTVRHFPNNAVYWNGVEGFRASYLTAFNDGYYGIYAYASTDGRFEYCHASGHPDAGFYLGHRRPFEAVVTGVVAEYDALGTPGPAPAMA